MTRCLAFSTAALLGVVSSAGAIGLAPVARGFEGALYVTQAPGEQRLLVMTKSGVVRPITKAGRPGPVWMDIRSRVGSSGAEQGLLGMAFSPDFVTSRRFYVNYTDRAGNTKVVEFRAAPNARSVNTRTARTVLAQRQPYSNHNGGNLQFGPDGMLYIGFGDGGGQKDPDSSAGNPLSLLGKIVRIDPSRRDRGLAYAIPAGNPFVDDAKGRPEVWALGLRNPWRFTFDRATGDMWIGDVGQNAVEEIDHIAGDAAGRDFGWSRREGTDDMKGGPRVSTETDPVTQYRHSDGNCSVTGGYVLRGGTVPVLEGQYVFGDWCSGRVWAIPANGSAPMRDITAQLGRIPGVTSFGQDRAGNTYVVTDTTVRRIKA